MSLADKISKKDLDAFRIGIEEQTRRDERQKLWREEMERDLKKRPVRRVKLVNAQLLLPGDVLVESRGMVSFCERDVVREISGAHLRPDGRMWVETSLGGQAVHPSDQILIEDRDI